MSLLSPFSVLWWFFSFTSISIYTVLHTDSRHPLPLNRWQQLDHHPIPLAFFLVHLAALCLYFSACLTCLSFADNNSFLFFLFLFPSARVCACDCVYHITANAPVFLFWLRGRDHSTFFYCIYLVCFVSSSPASLFLICYSLFSAFFHLAVVLLFAFRLFAPIKGRACTLQAYFSSLFGPFLFCFDSSYFV